MKMQSIKTEEFICDEVFEGDIEECDDFMDFDDEDLKREVPEEDVTEEKYELGEMEPTSTDCEMPSHLGELIWLKAEPTDMLLEKEPELDDPMSFGHFEEQGTDRKKLILFNEVAGSDQPVAKFTCFYCGNESYCLKRLRAHIKTTHAGPKMISDQNKIYEAIIIYSCLYCDYRTNDNSLYSNHLRSHLAELPMLRRQWEYGWLYDLHRFRCPLCTFRTSENEDIRHHMNSVHGNQRPLQYLRERNGDRKPIMYPCRMCDYTAGRSGTLKRHIMAKHTKERPFRCVHCPYQATQSETLRRHVSAKHKKGGNVFTKIPILTSYSSTNSSFG